MYAHETNRYRKKQKGKFKSLVFRQYFGQQVFYALCLATFRYVNVSFHISHIILNFVIENILIHLSTVSKIHHIIF